MPVDRANASARTAHKNHTLSSVILGTFYMELDDVRNHFDEIVVCGVHPEWIEHRLSVEFPPDYASQHAAFEVTVGEVRLPF